MSEVVDTLHYKGGPVKAIEGQPEGRIGGYLVRYSSPSDPDLTGEFFTKDTQFGPNKTPALVYHHGMDGALRSTILGSAEVKFDDVGMWVEAQLALRDSYEKALLEMVKAGKLSWSSGAVGHLVEREPVGKAQWIKTWILGEASLTPIPAEWRNTAVPLKSLVGATETTGSMNGATGSMVSSGWSFDSSTGTLTGTNYTYWDSATTTPTPSFTFITTSRDAGAEQKAAGAAAEANAVAAENKTMDKEQENVPAGISPEDAQKMVEDAIKAYDEKRSKTVEPEMKAAPAVITDTSHWAYDKYSPADIAFGIEFLNDAAAQNLKSRSEKARPASNAAVKALAMRLEGEDGKHKDYIHARHELKSVLNRGAIKANEIQQSTLASYGDEWVGVAYSSNLWDRVRDDTMIVSQIPSFEFPAGAESFVLPLESTDPTWYNVAQAASLSANPGGIPTNTVTASQMGTAQKTLTLGKLGARVLYTGELNEDAFLPFAPQLRAQLGVSAAEYLEAVLIDGDTVLTATTNINDIAGTPSGAEHFVLFNGFRKVALLGASGANSRDGTTLAVEDYLDTAKLMGNAGKVGRDRRQVIFIIDGKTHDASLVLTEVKTQDVFSRPTIEGGMMTNIWGYPVYVSGSICFSDPNGANLSNTAGKVDQDTPANNTKGQILAVRKDYWKFGYRRRMTVEAQRVAAADSTEIVSLMRFSIGYRDDEAAAITYNLTV